MSEPEMVSPLPSMALREPPPTGLPLTVSVPEMAAFPPTVRSLADVKFEADMSKQDRLLWTVAELASMESLGVPPCAP